MEVNIKKCGDWKVLTLTEERLDRCLAATFKDELTKAISDGTKNILLELSAVKFIDSSGLGTLLSCRERVEGRLAIASAPRGLQKQLKLTDQHETFQLVGTPEELLGEEESPR
jgi:anti-sigma B factor antagonist